MSIVNLYGAESQSIPTVLSAFNNLHVIMRSKQFPNNCQNLVFVHRNNLVKSSAKQDRRPRRRPNVLSLHAYVQHGGSKHCEQKDTDTVMRHTMHTGSDGQIQIMIWFKSWLNHI